jgi:hypothetical protein
MFDRYELWNTHTLLGVMREVEAPSNYWLGLAFPNVITSDQEYIDFEKIPSVGRKLAPFVMPLAQGRPIYEEQSRVHRFKPAYSKSLDPVTPTRTITKRPGSLLSDAPMSQMAKYNAIKADILAYHRDATERRWEWLAAQAIIEGKVTIEGDDYPAVTVDFGRDAGHTITLGVGARWGETGVSIMDDIQTWIDLMHDAEFGGAPTRITIGTDVWKVMRKDEEIRDLLDINLRGSDVQITRGLLPAGEVRFVGTLGIGLDVYVYNDYYHAAGSVVRFMNAKDVVLTGPNVMGYRCYGAIQDVNAQFQPLPIFPRNFIPQNDPAIEHILTQSAPLMVPVNPNATLKARVLA